MWYSQNDPSWASVNLGAGPGLIGPYGCFLTALANMGHFCAGGNTNPPGLSGFLLNLGRFVQGDLLPDNALDGLFDCKYIETRHYEGIPANLDYPQDAPLEQYIVEIDASPAAGVQTHFVLYYDGHTAANFRIVDSWDGQVKYLSAYGDPATIIQKFIHYSIQHPAPAPVPAPAPIPEPPAPVKVQSPEPVVPAPSQTPPPESTPPPVAPAEPSSSESPKPVLVPQTSSSPITKPSVRLKWWKRILLLLIWGKIKA